jgi:hypothetical protein
VPREIRSFRIGRSSGDLYDKNSAKEKGKSSKTKILPTKYAALTVKSKLDEPEMINFVSE